MDLNSVKETFKGNVQSVHKLMNFDRDVQDVFIEHIADLSNRLKTQQRITNDLLNGERQLQMLRQIRENDSLRPRYEAIFNQAVVLAVSYFGSAIHDILRLCIADAIKHRQHKRLLNEEFKVSIADLIVNSTSLEEAIGDLFITRKDISFQDMQSIGRAFSDYLEIAVEKDAIVNDIICGQACRHAIVHDGARVNARVIRQISAANPRRLKQKIKEGDNLKFSPEEVDMLCVSMSTYIESLCGKLQEKYRISTKS